MKDKEYQRFILYENDPPEVFEYLSSMLGLGDGFLRREMETAREKAKDYLELAAKGNLILSIAIPNGIFTDCTKMMIERCLNKIREDVAERESKISSFAV